jgi:hypothetical protein
MLEIGCGAVAQLGERVVRNDEVSGSIPLSSTIHKNRQNAPLVSRNELASGDGDLAVMIEFRSSAKMGG